MEFELCLAHTLRRADRVISQFYNEHLAPLSLRVTQFSILRALDLLGSTTAAHLREALVLEQATVSRALKPLIRDGYINVMPGADGREKQLSLSKEGKALYEEALGPWNQAQEKLKARLGSTGTEDLVKLSNRIVELKK